jgi:AraC-like DNA-binding protein/mannose-6-phosphate isomerase-like protein (cupin superfamily)
MAGDLTVIEVPPDARLPWVSRVLHMRARGHTGMHARASKEHELHFISRGKLTINLEGGEITLSAGQILYTDPASHYGVSDAVPGDLSCFHCHFTLPGAHVSHIDQREWDGRSNNINALAAGRERLIVLPRLWKIKKPIALAEQFLAMMNDQRGRHQGDAIAAQARFLLLLRSISADATEQPASRATNTTRSSRAHVARALDLIERKPGRSTLSGIASALEIEPEYLARLFKQQVGCSVGSYATRRAMALAQERLLSDQTTVRNIARALGFSDALYFSRVFKRKVGYSAREFRNRTLR